MFSTGRSARGPCGTGFESFDHVVLKSQPPTCRVVGEVEPRRTAWGEARPALAAKTTTPSALARACSVGAWPLFHGAKRAPVARHRTWKPQLRRVEAAAADLGRCRCSRASANGVGWSAPRVGLEDNHAKSASAGALWAVRWFSTARSARGLRGTVCGSYAHEHLKPQPPTWRGCAEVQPRPTAWDGARSALAAQTPTSSPQARACYMGGRPVSDGPERARAARHDSRTLWVR